MPLQLSWQHKIFMEGMDPRTQHIDISFIIVGLFSSYVAVFVSQIWTVYLYSLRSKHWQWNHDMQVTESFAISVTSDGSDSSRLLDLSAVLIEFRWFWVHDTQLFVDSDETELLSRKSVLVHMDSSMWYTYMVHRQYQAKHSMLHYWNLSELDCAMNTYMHFWLHKLLEYLLHFPGLKHSIIPTRTEVTLLTSGNSCIINYISTYLEIQLIFISWKMRNPSMNDEFENLDFNSLEYLLSTPSPLLESTSLSQCQSNISSRIIFWNSVLLLLTQCRWSPMALWCL